MNPNIKPSQNTCNVNNLKFSSEKSIIKNIYSTKIISIQTEPLNTSSIKNILNKSKSHQNIIPDPIIDDVVTFDAFIQNFFVSDYSNPMFFVQWNKPSLSYDCSFDTKHSQFNKSFSTNNYDSKKITRINACNYAKNIISKYIYSISNEISYDAIFLYTHTFKKFNFTLPLFNSLADPLICLDYILFFLKQSCNDFDVEHFFSSISDIQFYFYKNKFNGYFVLRLVPVQILYKFLMILTCKDIGQSTRDIIFSLNNFLIKIINNVNQFGKLVLITHKTSNDHFINININHPDLYWNCVTKYRNILSRSKFNNIPCLCIISFNYFDTNNKRHIIVKICFSNDIISHISSLKFSLLREITVVAIRPIPNSLYEKFYHTHLSSSFPQLCLNKKQTHSILSSWDKNYRFEYFHPVHRHVNEPLFLYNPIYRNDYSHVLNSKLYKYTDNLLRDFITFQFPKLDTSDTSESSFNPFHIPT